LLTLLALHSRHWIDIIKDFDVSGATAAENVESFVWDGLALISRSTLNAERGTQNGVSYTIEPHANGGSPILVSHKDAKSQSVIFNDMLGSSLGTVENGSFSEIRRTSFGENLGGSVVPCENFFAGKPQVEGLGYTFLFRNYRSDLGKWQTADPLGYPDGWNNLAYCNNWVTSCYDWLGAWGEEVHYTMTKIWAKSMGFTDAEAERIATADNNTDWSSDTHPFGVTGDQSRHFDLDDNPTSDSRITHAKNDIEAATDAWKNGRQEDALDLFGRGLHSLQDIDAHRDWDPRIPGVPDWYKHPDWYDDIMDPRNREAYKNTRERTFDAIRFFRKQIAE